MCYWLFILLCLCLPYVLRCFHIGCINIYICYVFIPEVSKLIFLKFFVVVVVQLVIFTTLSYSSLIYFSTSSNQLLIPLHMFFIFFFIFSNSVKLFPGPIILLQILLSIFVIITLCSLSSRLFISILLSLFFLKYCIILSYGSYLLSLHFA